MKTTNYSSGNNVSLQTGQCPSLVMIPSWDLQDILGTNCHKFSNIVVLASLFSIKLVPAWYPDILGMVRKVVPEGVLG